MEFIDIYILLEKQSREQVALFREKYLYNLKQADEDYVIPQNSDETQYCTDSVEDVLDYLFTNGPIESQLYWNNPHKSNLINGMIFFNNDGSLILGLSIMPEFEERFSSQLKKDFKSKYIIAYGEGLPPLERSKFIKEFYWQEKFRTIPGTEIKKANSSKRKKVVKFFIKLTIFALIILFLSREKVSELITLRMQGKVVYKVVKAIRGERWTVEKQSTIDGYREVNDRYYVSETISKDDLRSLAELEVRTVYQEDNRYIAKFFRPGNEDRYYELFEISEDADIVYFKRFFPEYSLTRLSDLKYLLKIEDGPVKEFYNAIRMHLKFEYLSGGMGSTLYILQFEEDGDTVIDFSSDKKMNKIVNITVLSFERFR